ncbi:TetR/AcrR family transcriptional regulator [Paenibacillus sp. FSL R5-808]|uniref:TetR/AcrR family transcriptional regulator n=1 Tax=Paenibacillus sp. FSL R5-808 TaxID=1227076 RepID=UPI0003E24975|nr:TetR/AcrR family transcriptional regulator [Paenibacillus sp. FSL R5-808]ETT40539.1 putative TetR family transcriptional regulator [Paenibacillus sp. FSL R5-808]
MVRPREFQDEAIFDGVYRALCKKGYGQVALTDITHEMHISPAALMKRFGSKKNMFLAYSDYVIELTRQSFHEASLSDQPRIDALKAVFKHSTSRMSHPVELANHTSFYLESTADPDLLEKTQYRLRLIDEFTRQMLNQAITNNEIIPCDVASLSRVLQAAISGAMLIWIKESNRSLDELFDESFDVIFASLTNSDKP